MEILISLIVAAVLVEFYAWLPRASKWIVECAVRGVCAEARERCREEWCGAIDALPNSILQFIHALSYVFGGAAAKINEDIFVGECEVLDTLLTDAASRYDVASRTFEQGARDLQQRPQHRIQDVIDDAVAQLENLPAEERRSHVESLRAFAGSVEVAMNRASDLFSKSLNKAIAQLDERKKVLRQLQSQLGETRNLACDSRTPVWRIECALNGLRRDVATALDLLEGDDWGDDAAMAAHDSLVALLQRTLNKVRDWVEKIDGEE